MLEARSFLFKYDEDNDDDDEENKENDKKKKNSKLQRSHSERLKPGLNRSHSSTGRLAQHLAAKLVKAKAPAAASGATAAAQDTGQPPPPSTQQPQADSARQQPQAESPVSPGGGNTNKQMPANAKCPKLDSRDIPIQSMSHLFLAEPNSAQRFKIFSVAHITTIFAWAGKLGFYVEPIRRDIETQFPISHLYKM